MEIVESYEKKKQLILNISQGWIWVVGFEGSNTPNIHFKFKYNFVQIMVWQCLKFKIWLNDIFQNSSPQNYFLDKASVLVISQFTIMLSRLYPRGSRRRSTHTFDAIKIFNHKKKCINSCRTKRKRLHVNSLITLYTYLIPPC